jgi:citrate synthase
MSDTPTVTLQYPGGAFGMPIVATTDGEPAIDVSRLLSRTGLITLDPGFVNTACCASSITYIDGDSGILRYRGYPIEQLASSSSFLEICYLLVYGELPTSTELEHFDDRVRRHTMVHEDLKRLFDGFPRDAHLMPVLSSSVNALSTYYQDYLDPLDPEQVEISTIRLLAKVPTLAACAYKRSIGQPFIDPDNTLGLVEGFLRMAFGVPAEPYEMDPIVVRALDLLFVLHADHEQNCSTATVRTVGSAHANVFVSVAAGINALSGPLHGGANQAVLEMLEGIASSGYDVDTFMKKVKDRNDDARLMGFGHRVYKNYDPRAKIIKAMADEVLQALGCKDELFDIAMRLEEIALSDEYFVERRLYPNVDFYTGLIYKAMGFPPQMFTALFVLGRLPGWIAQWREMINDRSTRIGRPRQLYIGPGLRDVERPGTH